MLLFWEIYFLKIIASQVGYRLRNKQAYKRCTIYIKQSNLKTSSDEEGYLIYICPNATFIDEQNEAKEVVIAFELIGYENKVINFLTLPIKLRFFK